MNEEERKKWFKSIKSVLALFAIAIPLTFAYIIYYIVMTIPYVIMWLFNKNSFSSYFSSSRFTIYINDTIYKLFH